MNLTKPLILTALLLGSSSVIASPDDHRISVGGGVWGVMDDADKGALHLGYEFAEYELLWGIRPTLVGFTDGDAQHYFSVGWLKEFALDDKWSWGFGGQAGYFHNSGNLGYDVEFYTRVLANYNVSKDLFFRGELGHISNAGLGDTNPGSENLTVSFNWSF